MNKRRNRKKIKVENRKTTRNGQSSYQNIEESVPISNKAFVLNEQGTHECYTQKDIHSACIVENKIRFSQSRSTPPMNASLIDSIGCDAEKEDTPKYMVKVIGKIRKPNSARFWREIGTNISLEEYVTGWKY